ncbi:MAG: hypothetical protein ACRCYY_05030 [Trueperaceae bacterium]
MSLREEIQKRISSMDDAVLPKLLKELEEFEKREQGRERFSKDFLSTLTRVRERNKGENPDVILDEISGAVQEHRQTQK